MHRVISLLVIVSASTACGASAATSGTNAKGGDASVASESDGAAPCSEPPDARPPGATCVLEVKGTVEDLSGTPLDQLVMTFCGFECFGTQSNDAGAFDDLSNRDVPSDQRLRPSCRRPTRLRRRLPPLRGGRTVGHHRDDASALASAEHGVVAARRRARVERHRGGPDAAHPGQHDVRPRHRGLRDGRRPHPSRRLRAARERPGLRDRGEGRRDLRDRAVEREVSPRCRRGRGASGQDGGHAEELGDASCVGRGRPHGPRRRLLLDAPERRHSCGGSLRARVGRRSDDPDGSGEGISELTWLGVRRKEN